MQKFLCIALLIFDKIMFSGEAASYKCTLILSKTSKSPGDNDWRFVFFNQQNGAYDINQISGRAVADILATHSHVLMNGKIHKNPNFVPPFEYLQQLIRKPKRVLRASKSY